MKKTKKHLIDLSLGILLGLIICLPIRCIREAQASTGNCVTHQVVANDTLFKVAEHYLEDGKRWPEIQLLNHIRGTTLRIGQTLEVCDAIWLDWESACKDLIAQRLAQLRQEVKTFWIQNAIVEGIQFATQIDLVNNRLESNAYQKLEMCRCALVTAQQETNFQFAIGAVGEIGMYQFRLDTVRLVYDRHLQVQGRISDHYLVSRLLDPADATWVYLLHFRDLKERYGSNWQAWRRYNGSGPHAQIYADKAMEKYKEVRKLRLQKNHIYGR